MADESGDEFSFLKNRRAAVSVVRLPGFRVGFPVTLLALTVVFSVVCAALGHHTYTALLAIEPPATGDSQFYADLIDEQVVSALWAVAVMAILFSLTLAGLWIFHSYRILGPEVAFRRHVEALKNGDYAARVHLRKRDAFVELARDLNELSAILAANEKPDEAVPGSDQSS
ncbi:MAG: hypothetical protein CL910_22215 [Deltaproteobacteria bacterium]|jgi:hypothetical protein|nr:hypothetical protein [Deltaproteobacteria bacterium]